MNMNTARHNIFRNIGAVHQIVHGSNEYFGCHVDAYIMVKQLQGSVSNWKTAYALETPWAEYDNAVWNLIQIVLKEYAFWDLSIENMAMDPDREIAKFRGSDIVSEWLGIEHE